MKSSDTKESLKKRLMQDLQFHRDHIHVVEMKEGWVIKREGSKRTIQTVSSQEAAMNAIQEMKNVTKIYVHPKSGDISVENME